METNTDMLRGRVDIFVLKALSIRDGYGYDILNYIHDKTEGHYEMKQSSIYSVLKRLEKQGYIDSYDGAESNGAKRRYYTLTDAGRKMLSDEEKEWEYTRTLLDNLVSDKTFDLVVDTPPFHPSDLRPLTRRTGRSGETDSEEESIVETAVATQETENIVETQSNQPINVNVTVEIPEQIVKSEQKNINNEVVQQAQSADIPAQQPVENNWDYDVAFDDDAYSAPVLDDASMATDFQPVNNYQQPAAMPQQPINQNVIQPIEKNTYPVESIVQPSNQTIAQPIVKPEYQAQPVQPVFQSANQTVAQPFVKPEYQAQPVFQPANQTVAQPIVNTEYQAQPVFQPANQTVAQPIVNTEYQAQPVQPAVQPIFVPAQPTNQFFPEQNSDGYAVQNTTQQPNTQYPKQGRAKTIFTEYRKMLDEKQAQLSKQEVKPSPQPTQEHVNVYEEIVASTPAPVVENTGSLKGSNYREFFGDLYNNNPAPAKQPVETVNIDCSHINDLRNHLDKEGIKLRPYEATNSGKGLVQYLLVNRLYRDATILSYLFLVAMMLIVFLHKPFGVSLTAFVSVLCIALIAPISSSLIYFNAKEKKKKDNFNIKIILAGSGIIYITFFVVNLIVNLIIPNGHTLNSLQTYVPSIIFLVVPFFGGILSLLYSTKNYNMKSMN